MLEENGERVIMRVGVSTDGAIIMFSGHVKCVFLLLSFYI